MPKVVSRSAVSTSTDAAPTASSAAALRVYYCICGEFCLVIDRSLSSLPRRQTDDATIIRSQDSQDGSSKSQVFKLNVNTIDPVLVERTSGGHERQFRFCCTRCQLLIGYQSTPLPVKSGPFVYILKGALSQVQGEVPEDAFDGEQPPP
ncbi:hypothetical protein PENSPDRAFT_615100 [Peniophora sp. CONT]|nr:hypothetical protein PENSPDRAFT_615100 [Peniophora sp. CONT]